MSLGFQSGRWFRSRISLQDKLIVPHPPFTQYDPFDWYFPEEKASHQPSIHYQFLDVNASDSGEVIRFCERFGVLGQFGIWSALAAGGTETWLREFNAEPVETMTASEAAASLGPLTDRLFQHLGRLPSPELLCVPISIEEFRVRQGGFRQAVKSIDRFLDTHRGPEARRRVQNLVNAVLLRTSPRLEWDVQAQQWKFGWVMSSLDAHFFLMLALDLMGPGRIIFCPKCGKARYATNPRMKFCSPRCQNAFKVHAFYVRKREGQKQKKKPSRSKQHSK
jgi:hypothetical protein